MSRHPAAPLAPETPPEDRASAPVKVRESRPRDKRELILDAAIKVFARAGYHGARVSDIAREAGIAYGLVYHYFKNKDEILATIFEEQWSGFIGAVDDIVASGGTLRDRLVSIAALMLNAYRVRPDWVKVLVFEIQRSSRFAQPGQIRALGQLFETIRSTLMRAQEQGEIRPELNPDVAATMYLGALEMTLTGLVVGVTDLPEDEVRRRAYYLDFASTAVEIFMDGCGQRVGDCTR